MEVNKKALFPPVGPDIVNSYILLSSCGGKKISFRDFRLTLIRDMLARAGNEPRPSMPVGRQAQTSTKIVRLDTRHNKHWPVRNPNQRRCHLCSARGATRSVKFKCLSVLSVTWHFVWTKIVLSITTQKTTYKNIFSSVLHAKS